MKVRSFHGSEPSNGSGSQSLGLDVDVLDLTRLLMASKWIHFRFIVSYSRGIVIELIGLK